MFELCTNSSTKTIQCRSVQQDGSLSFFPLCPLSKGFTHILHYTGIKSHYWPTHILFNIKTGLIFQKATPLFWLRSLSNTLLARIYSISRPVSFAPSFSRTLHFAPLYGVAWLRKCLFCLWLFWCKTVPRFSLTGWGEGLIMRLRLQPVICCCSHKLLVKINPRLTSMQKEEKTSLHSVTFCWWGVLHLKCTLSLLFPTFSHPRLTNIVVRKV